MVLNFSTRHLYLFTFSGSRTGLVDLYFTSTTVHDATEDITIDCECFENITNTNSLLYITVMCVITCFKDKD